MTKHLYNCKTDGDQYRITKFTTDLEVESSYLLTETECECPAGHRHTCRHRQMLPKFIDRKATQGQWFLDYATDKWIIASGATLEDLGAPLGPSECEPQYEEPEGLDEDGDHETTDPMSGQRDLGDALRESAKPFGFTMLD